MEKVFIQRKDLDLLVIAAVTVLSVIKGVQIFRHIRKGDSKERQGLQQQSILPTKRIFTNNSNTPYVHFQYQGDDINTDENILRQVTYNTLTNKTIPLTESTCNQQQHADKSSQKQQVQAQKQETSLNGGILSKEIDNKARSSKQEVQVHKYNQKIQELASNPEVYCIQQEPKKPKPVDLKLVEIIETHDQVQQMVEDLKSVKRIAIDVEHNYSHSFLGYTCTIQISTGYQDFIVDGIKLHGKLGALRCIFSNPKIQKIVHGGDQDVQWLQRDFQLYLVNVVDTENIAQCLGLKPFGLKALLRKYLDVSQNAKMSRCDWTMRPLSGAMIMYAIQDVHFSLYLYDKMMFDMQQNDSWHVYLKSMENREVQQEQGKSLEVVSYQDVQVTLHIIQEELVPTIGKQSLEGIHLSNTVQESNDQKYGDLYDNHQHTEGDTMQANIQVDFQYLDKKQLQHMQRQKWSVNQKQQLSLEQSDIELQVGGCEEDIQPYKFIVYHSSKAQVAKNNIISYLIRGQQLALQMYQKPNAQDSIKSSINSLFSFMDDLLYKNHKNKILQENDDLVKQKLQSERRARRIEKQNSKQRMQNKPSIEIDGIIKDKLNKSSIEDNNMNFDNSNGTNDGGANHSNVLYKDPHNQNGTNYTQQQDHELTRLKHESNFEVDTIGKHNKGSYGIYCKQDDSRQQTESLEEGADIKIDTSENWISKQITSSPAQDSNFIKSLNNMDDCNKKSNNNNNTKYYSNNNINYDSNNSNCNDNNKFENGIQENPAQQHGTSSINQKSFHDVEINNDASSQLDLVLKETRYSYQNEQSYTKLKLQILNVMCWREKMAREYDQHINYVLHIIFLKKIFKLNLSRPLDEEEIQAQVYKFDDYDWFFEKGSHDAWCVFMRGKTTQLSDVIQKANEDIKCLHYLSKDQAEVILHGNSNHRSQERGKGRTAQSDDQKNQLINKFCSKSAVYHKCQILSQEGQLLCYTDPKKLKWYVQKGLANQLHQDPPTIQLNFSHKTSDQDNGQDLFYIQNRANQCVCCGEQGHYLRYRVIPSCYRRHFPVEFKTHRSHDVVLLCLECHNKAQVSAQKIKRKISQEYKVPLGSREKRRGSTVFKLDPKERNNSQTSSLKKTKSVNNEKDGGQSKNPYQVTPFTVRNCAQVLLKQNAQLPQIRKVELADTIRHYFKNKQQSNEHSDIDNMNNFEDFQEKQYLEKLQGHIDYAGLDLKTLLLALFQGLGMRQRKKLIKQVDCRGIEFVLGMPQSGTNSNTQNNQKKQDQIPNKHIKNKINSSNTNKNDNDISKNKQNTQDGKESMTEQGRQKVESEHQQSEDKLIDTSSGSECLNSNEGQKSPISQAYKADNVYNQHMDQLDENYDESGDESAGEGSYDEDISPSTESIQKQNQSEVILNEQNSNFSQHCQLQNQIATQQVNNQSVSKFKQGTGLENIMGSSAVNDQTKSSNNKMIKVDDGNQLGHEEGGQDSQQDDLQENTDTSEHQNTIRNILIQDEVKWGDAWHGQQIVQQILQRQGGNGLLDLMRQFRSAFVVDLEPKFLPGSWDVDHAAKREFGEFSVYTE